MRLTELVEMRRGVSATKAELVAFCRERLSGMRTPKAVAFWPQLPRSAVRKVDDEAALVVGDGEQHGLGHLR